jgi:galactokinase
VSDNPTRILGQTLALGDNPDDIQYDVRDGYAFIVLGNVAISLGMSSQAAIDKLATVTAQAAADNRASSLREVA